MVGTDNSKAGPMTRLKSSRPLVGLHCLQGQQRGWQQGRQHEWHPLKQGAGFFLMVRFSIPL